MDAAKWLTKAGKVQGKEQEEGNILENRSNNNVTLL
jgi:hypothetical protein